MTMVKLAVLWGGWKTAIETWLGLSADAVHIHVGVLLYLFFAMVTRRRMYHVWPWLFTLVVELGNEYIDLNQPMGSVEANWPASQHDILNTMFLPTVLLVGLRLRNRGFMRPPPQHD